MLKQSYASGVDCCELSVDELVEFISNLDRFAKSYGVETGMDAPEWAQDKLVAARTELKSKIRAEKQRRLASLRQQEAVYMSREEKRAKVQAERERLEKELA